MNESLREAVARKIYASVHHLMRETGTRANEAYLLAADAILALPGLASSGEAVAWRGRRLHLHGPGKHGPWWQPIAEEPEYMGEDVEVQPLYASPAGGEVYEIGQPVWCDMGDGVRLRATYQGDREGWPLLHFDADPPNEPCVHVRPSSVSRRDQEAAISKQGGK